MFKMNLQLLLIIWWIGAALASISLLIPQYNIYLISGSIGWATVIASTALIIIEIKRIKVDDKRRIQSEK